ncbi:MAG: NAD(P)/FAD-dependent oxidoreductase [Planctomycetota bacterium]|jgi:L-2-hydroxyglutarate oxidase LhgO|nr:NAD(P)/FAD-dependent oxidoreductase [Planctomycetota bacterium]
MDMDLTIVGGGAVGLAIAMRSAGKGSRVLLLERHSAFGRETSSRNSEVIHGGMYYPPGSLKAKLCVEGRRELYAFAGTRGVPARKTGKIIVAQDEAEIAALERIQTTGRANGVEGLDLLGKDGLSKRCPDLRAQVALWSPETGVVNAHRLMDALRVVAEEQGAVVLPGAEALGLEMIDGGWRVDFRDADGLQAVETAWVANAAGLNAQKVMRMAGLDPAEMGLTLHPCKGSYYSVRGKAGKRITSLVYPVPEEKLVGLGVHTIVDVAGGVKLGPDAEYVPEADEYDYAVDARRKDDFFRSAKRYLPFLEPGDIEPDMSGIRPKLYGPGEPERDFHIREERERGRPGFINLAGLESPGLTACLAIGKMVAETASG